MVVAKMPIEAISNDFSRPVPVIQNLALFSRILSNPSVARTGDDLFRFVAANGGRASDYRNLITALRAFGVYKKSGEPELVHDGVTNLAEVAWLHRATTGLYLGVIEPEFLEFGRYYSHSDALAEVRARVDGYWSYTVALKSDVAQFFFSINQHELINQLEHQGLQPEMVRRRRSSPTTR